MNRYIAVLIVFTGILCHWPNSAIEVAPTFALSQEKNSFWTTDAIWPNASGLGL